MARSKKAHSNVVVKKKIVSAKVSAASPKSLAARKNTALAAPRVAAKVTPVKSVDKASFKTFKYFFFELQDGKNETVYGVKKAETFLDEWESIVANVRKFKSKTLYDKFISSRGTERVPTKNMLETPPKSASHGGRTGSEAVCRRPSHVCGRRSYRGYGRQFDCWSRRG
jgi:hypothetical protein